MVSWLAELLSWGTPAVCVSWSTLGGCEWQEEAGSLSVALHTSTARQTHNTHSQQTSNGHTTQEQEIGYYFKMKTIALGIEIPIKISQSCEHLILIISIHKLVRRFLYIGMATRLTTTKQWLLDVLCWLYCPCIRDVKNVIGLMTYMPFCIRFSNYSHRQQSNLEDAWHYKNHFKKIQLPSVRSWMQHCECIWHQSVKLQMMKGRAWVRNSYLTF